MPAVVLSFDVFPLSLLGCYGCTTLQTPNWDRLATRGVLFDQHYGRDFSGQPAWEADSARLSVELFRHPSLSARLISETAASPVGYAATLLKPEDQPGPAGSHLPLAWLIQQGCRILSETPSTDLDRQLLWLHSAGFTEPFAAPGAFADREEGRAFSTSLEEYPDRVDRAAEYVARADFWLGELLQTLEKHCPQDELLFMLTAARSELVPIPTLSRDSRIQRTGLTEEIVHAPLLIWSPGLLPGRRQELVQPPDLLPTLAEWFKLPLSDGGISLWPLLRDAAGASREAICLKNADFQAVRTPAEYLILPRGETRPDLLELSDSGVYIVKPQDVWDVHNRIAEFPEQAERLLDWLYPRKESTSG